MASPSGVQPVCGEEKSSRGVDYDFAVKIFFFGRFWAAPKFHKFQNICQKNTNTYSGGSDGEPLFIRKDLILHKLSVIFQRKLFFVL